MPFYAVAKGRKCGIYHTWPECEAQVKGYKGAVFKKFKAMSEAQSYIEQFGDNNKQGFAQQLGCCIGVPANVVQIKQELPESDDYIPLESQGAAGMEVKEEIKTEPSDNDMWFKDSEGDEELLLALSALKEYPDNKKRTHEKKTANKRHIKIGAHSFTADDEDFVDAYIGGAYDNIGNWNCMAGYGVYFGPHHPLNVAKAATGRMTHNVGDIEAAIDAIEIAERCGIPKLCIHTGSEFLLHAVTSWMYHWKRNNWRNKAGKVVQNRKELEKLNTLLNESNVAVKWHNVKGYRNALKPMREAEVLARAGMEDYLDQHPSKDDTFPMDAYDFGFY